MTASDGFPNPIDLPHAVLLILTLYKLILSFVFVVKGETLKCISVSMGQTKDYTGTAVATKSNIF